MENRTELQHIDLHSYGHDSVSFPFSWAAQPGGLGTQSLWVLVFSTASYLKLIWSSCAPSYIIVRHPPSPCGRHKSHSFKFISWYSSTGCTCYLHRCISYFDSLAGVNMQHQLIVSHWSLNDSKIPQVFRILLGILADLNNVVVRMVATHPLISKSSRFFINNLMAVPRAQIIICIIVCLLFYCCFRSLERSWYLPYFSLSFSVTQWSAGTAKWAIRQILFYM